MRPKRLKSCLLVVILLGLSFLQYSETARAAGVRPLFMNMDLRPGDQRTFEITLMPGDVEELVDLTLYESIQQLSGALMYQLPTNPSFSPTSWVTLDTSTVRVLPGEETTVTGTVRVPFTASGSHTVIIMVEPRAPDVASGISFQVRYAVRLNIRIEGVGLRATAELISIEVTPDEQGAPRITARIKNTSTLDYLVSGEVVIRDQNKRLVERVSMKTAAAVTAGADATRVYPGATVDFLGNITRPIEPGDYSMQTFFRYAEAGQILQKDDLVIHAGEYAFPGFENSVALIVSPSTAEHVLRDGERKSQVFEFESIVGEPVRVGISLREVTSNYEHSLVPWLELRSQEEFILPPRAKTRLAMTIAVPRSGLEGSYHGQAVFQAFGTESNTLYGEIAVPLSVLVGTEHSQALEIRSVGSQVVDEESIYLAVDLYNSGNIAFLPGVQGIIFGEDGDFVERVVLEFPEEMDSLLPMFSQQVGAMAHLPESGQYELELQITSAQEEILKEKHTIFVAR